MNASCLWTCLYLHASVDSIAACVAKAMRLKDGVAATLKNVGGKHRAYRTKTYDEIGIEAATVDATNGAGATGSDDTNEQEQRKDEL